MRAVVTWQDGMTFEGETETGLRVTAAAAPAAGEVARGPRPTELVLVALGSCTGMDVAGILRKMRQPFTDLSVEVVGEQVEEHPKVFSRIELRYTVRGRALDPALVEKAIRLSQERYCSVAAMLRPAVGLTYTWQVDDLGAGERRLTA